MPKPIPDLTVEHSLFASGVRHLASLDEVGRGAWAGPVSVGVVLTSPGLASPPEGLTDSKYLTARGRQRLAPATSAWVEAYSIGSANAHEIDQLGIIAALRLAANRALAELPIVPDAVLLDGNHDFLTPRDRDPSAPRPVPVRTEIKGDARCATLSAASVLAKVHRDGLMHEYGQSFPEYGWGSNSGYMSAAHRAAVAEHGLTPLHRRTWSHRS